MHHDFDDSDSGYDVDPDHKQGKSFGIGGYRGRIIFLGDGTEVLTDSDDTEMFDNSEEDKDLESQVSKGTTQDSGSAAGSEAEPVETTETPKKLSDDEKSDTPAEEEKTATAESKPAAVEAKKPDAEGVDLKKDG